MKSLKQFMEELSMVTIVMIGGPGSGKSTYSKNISGHFDIPHIYTGDMMILKLQRLWIGVI